MASVDLRMKNAILICDHEFDCKFVSGKRLFTFEFYKLRLFRIVEHLGIHGHRYTDWSQLGLKPNRFRYKISN